ncbi:MAG: FAD-dependent oxidoreductase [Candidatus Jidaibacter sp.]|jgi:NADPH-dependent glutamate synthase beta subunit-like oxidoreductase/NAD(P)H-flavin reductase|nr:FAD-dependent oxidoreductase [Candidatus Jidaibacter sp.]
MLINFGLSFHDLYYEEGLRKIDALWLKHLESISLDLYQSLNIARSTSLDAKTESDLIISLAPHVEDFIAKLFHIELEVQEVANIYHEFAPIYKCKRLFIQRNAVKNFSAEDLTKIDSVRTSLASLGVDVMSELSFATFVESTQDKEKLELARIYAGWACLTPEGQKLHKDGILFKVPKKLDFNNLLSHADNNNGSWSSHDVHDRNGFSLTDKGITKLKAYDQANYCIHCHNQLKDSCSHGLKNPDASFKVNELKINLAGCPLEEKISEMNLLKSQGSVIGAFATAIIDNPMLAATGHRICNDCMKSCIYQKQEPVNIPMIETKILDDVLSLPWGFEIYSLLTRWNPINFSRPLPKKHNNYKILVAGLGPAGFTACHHLLNEGYTVVAIDGLKIEPQAEEIAGNDYSFKPIKFVKDELFQDLDSRAPQGFGGVAEYGITVRWNKNYLNIVRTLLERREHFRMYGGIRFGSTITYNDAKSLGFDHIVLALGAGKPNLPEIQNALARGCRMASDFLMSLQLTGAAHSDSLTNLQVRLPIVVIGGGLTAVDTATESLAYYPVQVEKFLRQYEIVGDSIFESLTREEKLIAEEFLNHAKELRKHPDRKLELLKLWGGSKVLYRKNLTDSPAYRLNHEEVELALAEGIEFVENITPTEVVLDTYGAAKTLKHEGGEIAARTILIATGTQPNTILSTEDEIHFSLHGRYFQAIDSLGNIVDPEKISKPKSVDIITNYGEDGPSVSFLGDLHPSFAGNVVKAMASAKQGYPIIDKVIKTKSPSSATSASKLFSDLDHLLKAKVIEVIKLTPNIIEIVIHAPQAARQFEPGQFYRLQNYDTNKTINSFKINMEGLALTGAWVDKEKGLIGLVVLEMGGSSNFCRILTPGEDVVLMGPTGTPTHIPHNKNVMLVGGGLGNAVLFSIGQALKNNGCSVLYFAGYKKAVDRFKQGDIENSATQVVWCCDESELEKGRDSDLSFKGNILECIAEYAKFPNRLIEIKEVDHVIVIGSDQMMKAVAYARHNQLSHLFKEGHTAIGSINSPMQCMMKEICGQCIQRHVDPSGQEYYVYSCFNQDQDLDSVDFNHLNTRLKQNSLQEKMCARVLLKA